MEMEAFIGAFVGIVLLKLAIQGGKLNPDLRPTAERFDVIFLGLVVFVVLAFLWDIWFGVFIKLGAPFWPAVAYSSFAPILALGFGYGLYKS